MENITKNTAFQPLSYVLRSKLIIQDLTRAYLVYYTVQGILQKMTCWPVDIIHSSVQQRMSFFVQLPPPRILCNQLSSFIRLYVSSINQKCCRWISTIFGGIGSFLDNKRMVNIRLCLQSGSVSSVTVQKGRPCNVGGGWLGLNTAQIGYIVQ